MLGPERVTTYNIEVATHHNYFAGGILVHNKDAPPTPDPGPTLP
jgi:hypothetical protein